MDVVYILHMVFQQGNFEQYFKIEINILKFNWSLYVSFRSTQEIHRSWEGHSRSPGGCAAKNTHCQRSQVYGHFPAAVHLLLPLRRFHMVSGGLGKRWGEGQSQEVNV